MPKNKHTLPGHIAFKTTGQGAIVNIYRFFFYILVLRKRPNTNNTNIQHKNSTPEVTDKMI